MTGVLLISAVEVKAQESPDLSNLEEMNVDINLELLSNGRCHFDVQLQGEGGTTGGLGLELPMTSLDITLQVDSPSSGELEADADLNVDLFENQIGPEIEALLSLVDENAINNGIPGTGFDGLKSFEGKTLSSTLGAYLGQTELPSELADLTINEISCTKFSWNKPALRTGFSSRVSGTIFENEELIEELPLDVSGSIEYSADSLSVSFELEGAKNEVDLSLTSSISDSTQTISFDAEGEVELPREDGEVQWDFGIPEGETTFASKYLGDVNLEGLIAQLGQENIEFTLTVPSDAKVSGLPAGSQKEGNSYTWTGESAANAVMSMASGETEGEITYESEPSGGGTSLRGLPWMWIGIGIAVVAILIVASLTVRRR